MAAHREELTVTSRTTGFHLGVDDGVSSLVSLRELPHE
jgi:hypothetical protein